MMLAEFRLSEGAHYTDEGRNRLDAATSSAIKCEQYLPEIVRRYGIAAKLFCDYVPPIERLQVAAQLKSLDVVDTVRALSHLSMLVHLEIESFYLFSKILLDRTARLVHWWLTHAREARGISVSRHSRLAKNLGALIERLQLAAPDGILEVARALDTRISDYRDDEVAHHERHGFFGTKFTDTGHAMIVQSAAGVALSAESGQLEELHGLLVRYVDLVVELLSSDRKKGKLAPYLVRQAPPDLADTRPSG